MFIDLHCHEKQYSDCSHITVEEIVADARAKHLDAVCITDHDSLDIFEHAHKVSNTLSFPIFVGAEVFTFEGDVLVFGLDHIPKKRLHLIQLLAHAKDEGAFCICAHPYRDNNRGVKDAMIHLESWKNVCGVEIANGRTTDAENAHAKSSNLKAGLYETGGSDAHERNEVGTFATWLPTLPSNEKELAALLSSGLSRVARPHNGIYQIDDIW